MSTKELLLEKLKMIHNESILEELLAIVDIELNIKTEPIQLSSEHLSAIDKGLKNIEEGKIFSNDEARKMIEEWLKKR